MNVDYWLTHSYIVTLCRWFVAGVLIYSGVSKISNRQQFLLVVKAFHILPARVTPIFSTVVPWLEVFVGGALLLGIRTTLSAALAGFLLSCFTAAIVINLLRGRTELDCGCFGRSHNKKIGVGLVIRNAALIVLSCYVATYSNGYFALESLFASRFANMTGPPLLGLLLLALAVASLFTAALGVKQLMSSERANRS